MSWYHSLIPRIPHGNQNPTKRYITDEELLDVFDGFVTIQEKVDGKQSILDLYGDGGMTTLKSFLMLEDMTGKNTVHKHVMHYNELPATKKIIFDKVAVRELGLKDGEIQHELIFDPPVIDLLSYGRIILKSPSIEEIYALLEMFSQMKSHFGSKVIEGLVIKNYRRQIMAKWINDAFEDKLP